MIQPPLYSILFHLAYYISFVYYLSCSHNFDKIVLSVTSVSRHAEVMKKIIETVAEGGGELGVHMYP